MLKSIIFIEIIILYSQCIVLSKTVISLNNIKEHPNWPNDMEEDCGINEHDSDRIIGGNHASLGEYPWLARLGYEYGDGNIDYDCGGVLVNRQYILTAAHCAVDLPADAKLVHVVLGEHNSAIGEDCIDGECADPIQTHSIEKVLYPKEYNMPAFKNDIALIKLNGLVRISSWIRPICLPFGKNLIKNMTGMISEVAGWGLLSSDHEHVTDFLQKLTIPIVSIDICSHIYGGSIDIGAEQLCVGGELGKDSCAGDSGGPLVMVRNTPTGPRYILYGIVSFGNTHCGKSETPGVYTNVQYYLLWILANLNK